VAQYLLAQLLVNVIYAVPVGLGLWAIGVPNPTLWALMTLVLRFVPYIGTILAAAFPLFLAFAVAPGWTAVLWTIALFATVEAVTSNVIEPYIYGSRTGVSPLAIIVAAIFWTWIWGPFGLVLSTPLTVCLVVLGRHIPQFAVFDTLFGDDPVLEPHARLYQRLLVGDALEATFRAEEALETQFLGEYYRDVGIPALLIAQNDHARGVLTHEQQAGLAAMASALVRDLESVVVQELDEVRATPGADLAGQGRRVLCIGGRSDLDDAAAAMVGQALAADGADVGLAQHGDLTASRFRVLDIAGHDCVLLTFLDGSPSRTSLLHIRRIKMATPKMRVGVLICENRPHASYGQDPAAIGAGAQGAVLAEAIAIGADFAAGTLEDAMRGALDLSAATPLPTVKRQPRARPALAALRAPLRPLTAE
jgi:hypothetical protein